MAPEKPFFKCRDCGCDRLRVVNQFTRYAHYERSRPCTCDDGESDYAVVQEIAHEISCTRTGFLNEGHRVDWDQGLDEEKVDTQVLDEQDQCRRCKDEDGEWESMFLRSENDEAQNEYYVYCDECDREIEFGYSHPGEGRIWPSECPDFNPWRTFPDHKYVESWKAKGWLRPDSPWQPPSS